MRILHINKFYSPNIGGVETVVKQYAEYSVTNNNITVLCINKSFTFKTKVEYINNVKVIRCSSLGTFFSMPVSLAFFFIFFKIRKGVDIIHFHEPFPLGSMLSLLTKKNKYIISWHSDIIKQNFLKKFVVFFQKELCNKADTILTTSPNLLKYSEILKNYKEKVRILPLSIPIFNPRSPIPDPKTHYLLYLGRLSYYKGINVLLEAFTKSNVSQKLLIVGDGEEKIISDIIHYTDRDKRIKFINKFISEKEKQKIIAESDFLLFPSIFSSEAFGIIQLEAMIMGKPIINTLLKTGVPWVSINEKTGITVTPDNVIELKIAIEKLSSSKDLRQKYGFSARKRVLKLFSNDVVLPKLKSIYQSLIASK